MNASVNLYSTKAGEINRFLTSLYHKKIELTNELKWSNYFENPVEISDIIGIFIENNDKYNIRMWISLDKGIYIYITEYNADKVIRYIFERFPY